MGVFLMFDRLLSVLMFVVVLVALFVMMVPLQYLAVWLGYPDGLWFWCDLLSICEVGGLIEES